MLFNVLKNYMKTTYLSGQESDCYYQLRVIYQQSQITVSKNF